MIIKNLFEKDIDRSIQGVVTIGNEDEEQKWQELEEYVCTDEIVKSFRTFFRKYRESLTVPTEKMGVWITGFFGSGKSRGLRMAWVWCCTSPLSRRKRLGACNFSEEENRMTVCNFLW